MMGRDELWTTCPEVGEAALTALLDGALTADERAQMEDHVRRCTTCSGDLARQRLAHLALHAAAGNLAAPAELRARVAGGLGRQGWLASVRRVVAAAGVAAAIAVAAVGVWRLNATTGHASSSTAVQVARAHRQETLSATPVAFVSADPAAVARWVRTQTGREVAVPDFGGAGYHLLGVRTESGVSRGAVSLVYAGAGGRVTCTILDGDASLGAAFSAPPGAPSVHTIRQDGVTEAMWLEPGTTYLMASELQPQEMLPLIAAFNGPGYIP